MLRSRTAIQRSQFSRKTYLLNCHSQCPEKISKKVNFYLWGAHKAIYHPHQDTGDCLILINTRNIKMEGNKWEEGFIEEFHNAHGNQKLIFRELHLLDPTKIVRYALEDVIQTPPPIRGRVYDEDYYLEMFDANPMKHKSFSKRNFLSNWVRVF